MVLTKLSEVANYLDVTERSARGYRPRRITETAAFASIVNYSAVNQLF